MNRHSWYGGQVILGATLLLMGILFLLDNAGMIEMGPIWRQWPLLLVAAGVGKFFNADSNKEKIEAAWLGFVGFWLYISINHLLGLRFGTSWPILIIGWGITILWKGMLNPSRNQFREEESLGQ